MRVSIALLYVRVSSGREIGSSSGGDIIVFPSGDFFRLPKPAGGGVERRWRTEEHTTRHDRNDDIYVRRTGVVNSGGGGYLSVSARENVRFIITGGGS